MLNVLSRLPKSLMYLFVAQFSAVFVLWNHVSDTPDFLNRYSKSYAVVVLVSVIVTVLWGVLLVLHRFVADMVTRIPTRWYFVGMGMATLVMLVVWLLPLEATIKTYVATQYLLAVVLLVMLRPDSLVASTRWQMGLVIIGLLMLVPMFITSLAERRFTPDEGHWADYASSSFLVGGIYARTWLQEPYRIMPGLGWSVAAYGWALEHIAFDIHVGRVWNFTFFLLAFAGIAALTWRLYGRSAAFFSTIFAVLSLAFVPFWDYRPDHQLPFASTIVLLVAVQARRTHRYAIVWHFACGLFATLSMQLHAAAIIFATACSLYYAIACVANLYRQRKWNVLWPVLGFGSGAFVGVIVYFVFNIEPVGGLQAYLATLVAREYLPDRLLYLTWVSLPEGLVIVAAFAYLFWRRNASDRLFLGLLMAFIFCAVMLDTQGYYTHHNALYVVPVGVLIADGLHSIKQKTQYGLRTILISSAIVAVLVGQMSGLFILWSDVGQLFRTGQFPPFLYEEMKPALTPYVHADDVVVSTHQLVWTLPYHPQLISFAAEYTAIKRWKLSRPIEVWERVHPTLIVDIEAEMVFNEGLQAYIQQQGFQICQTLHVLDRDIRLYRTTCN